MINDDPGDAPVCGARGDVPNDGDVPGDDEWSDAVVAAGDDDPAP